MSFSLNVGLFATFGEYENNIPKFRGSPLNHSPTNPLFRGLPALHYRCLRRLSWSVNCGVGLRGGGGCSICAHISAVGRIVVSLPVINLRGANALTLWVVSGCHAAW